jgi:hypothetical protein
MLAAALLGTVASAGCAGSPAAPTPVEILPQKYVLACGDWSPATPPVTRTLVDVYLNGPGSQLTEADLAILRRRGGDIVHQFAAGRQVRVAIDIARLLPLHTVTPPGQSPVSFATTVTNPAVIKVVMIVQLNHPVTDADLDAARALGGTIRNVYRFALQGYSLEIDDAMVPQLRGLPGVQNTSLNTIGCLVEA